MAARDTLGAREQYEAALKSPSRPLDGVAWTYLELARISRARGDAARLAHEVRAVETAEALAGVPAGATEQARALMGTQAGARLRH